MAEQNIKYKIKEKHIKRNKVNLEELIKEVDNKSVNGLLEIDSMMALEIDYSTNYTVKSLSQILDYYELNYRKLKKDEIIQMLVLFENDPLNCELVERRRGLWDNIAELKEDKYFKKFILFTL